MILIIFNYFNYCLQAYQTKALRIFLPIACGMYYVSREVCQTAKALTLYITFCLIIDNSYTQKKIY
jgi:hypothetical protein